jgi:hypothetical protein
MDAGIQKSNPPSKLLPTGIANIMIFNKSGPKPVHHLNSMFVWKNGKSVGTLINQSVFSINRPIWPFNWDRGKAKEANLTDIECPQPDDAKGPNLVGADRATRLFATVVPDEERELDRRKAYAVIAKHDIPSSDNRTQLTGG